MTSVLTPSASVVIDAPRELVWQVLMDWESYSEWNPFVRNQYLADPSMKPLPASQRIPRPGVHIYMHPVHIPPSFDPPRIFPAASNSAVITSFDADNFCCAWKTISFPSWLLDGVRSQALVEVVEEGRKKTRYECIEVFNGPLAYLIKFFLGRGLQQSFTAMAEGLKKRSEELQRGLAL